MTALDANVIERKLEFIIASLKEIEALLKPGQKSYLKNPQAMVLMERHIERLVEASVDAASHILRRNFDHVAPTYRETLSELGKNGVIPQDLATAIAPFAGLRNIIAHQYAEIDHAKLFEAASSAVKTFPSLVRALRDYLQKS